MTGSSIERWPHRQANVAMPSPTRSSERSPPTAHVLAVRENGLVRKAAHAPRADDHHRHDATERVLVGGADARGEAASHRR